MADYFDTGFCVRRPSWHQKESLLADYPDTWDDARMAAGLMWEPTYRDLYVPEVVPLVTATDALPEGAMVVERNTANGTATIHRPVVGHRAIVRDDTGLVLATPTDTFELIYHHQMGELLEAFTDEWRKAGAKVLFETAGSVEEGRKVWALVRLDEPWHAPGDDSATYPYGVLLNAHDGSGACRLTPTSVRVVCANTWRMADLQAERVAEAGVVLRHTGNVGDRLEKAKASLTAMRADSAAWQEEAHQLAGINITDAVVTMFMEEFIPVPEGSSDRMRASRADKRAAFRKLYDDSPTVADLPDTAWKLAQTAGEFLDHLRPYRSADTYLSRTLLRPEPAKGRSVQLIRRIAADLVPA